MNCLKKYVCNLKYSSFLLDSFKEIFSMNNLVPCVISGDATVASGDPMYKQNTKNSHVYLYQLQSLSPDYPVPPIHLKMNASPNFKIENLDDMIHLRDNIEGIGLTRLAICTDGDEGTDHYHIESFEKFDHIESPIHQIM